MIGFPRQIAGTSRGIAISVFVALVSVMVPICGIAQDDKRTEAERLYVEASGLYVKGLASANEPALEKFLTAITLFEALDPNDERIGLALVAAGTTAKRLGRRDQSLEIYSKALKRFQGQKDKLGQAIVLNQIGLVHHQSDEPGSAIEKFNQALGFARTVKEPKTLASVLNNLGDVYQSIGEYEKAIGFFNDSLAPRRIADDPDGEAATLGNLGLLYSVIGDRDRALTNLQDAAVIYRERGDLSGLATISLSFGKFLADSGDHVGAVKRYEDALALFEKTGDRASIGSTINNIGFTYHDLRRFDLALANFDRAISVHREIGDIDGEAIALGNAMFTWNAIGKRPTAIFFGKMALRKYQGIRRDLSGSERNIQLNYLGRIRQIYRVLAEFLVEENRLAEAHQVLVAYQDQDFLDTGRAASAGSLISLNQNEQIAAEKFDQLMNAAATASARLEEVNRAIGDKTANESQTAAKNSRVAELTSALTEVRTFCSGLDPSLGQTDGRRIEVETGPTAELRKTLADLKVATGRNAIAIQTLVGEQKFRALIITPDGIQAVSTPVTSTELNSLALQFWGLLQTPAYETKIISEKIHDIVFRPLAAKIPANTQTLMWGLDANLRYVPMAALWDGRKFLAERFDHVVFTRADRARLMRERSPVLSGVGFGVSKAAKVDLYGDGVGTNLDELRGVPVELVAIFGDRAKGKAGILKGEFLLDSTFTKDSFLRSLGAPPRLVHIASHFVFRPGDEKRSFLLLWNGSALTLEELQARNKLFDGVDLLILSACNTSASQGNSFGREIDGFAELAQSLGAAAVLATLWEVSDESTPTLMKEFYSGLAGANRPTKASALKTAQLGLLRGTARILKIDGPKPSTQSGIVSVIPGSVKVSERVTRSGIVRIGADEAPPFDPDPHAPFAHPHYWAPFVLYGNWR